MYVYTIVYANRESYDCIQKRTFSGTVLDIEKRVIAAALNDQEVLSITMNKVE